VPGLNRWPWIGRAVGGFLAAALNFVAGVALVLCEIADDYHAKGCDDQASFGLIMALLGAALAVILTVFVLVYPHRSALRWALWATPAVCFVALLIGIQVITN
jgi:hypothetical protein